MSLYKICFYVPIADVDRVKQAMFDAGAGRTGPNDSYDHCAWQTRGQGQFRPLPGSQPAIGQQDQEEFVDEYKVEMICAEECLPKSIGALKKTHPYEQAAYQVWPLHDI